MPGGRIIVIGASTGGAAALCRLMRDLPADLQASILIVQHITPTSRSLLPRILSRAGPLPAVHPHDGAPLEPGVVYVAPPDRHMVVEPGRVRLVLGPKENHSRPAVDALFRSAALAYAPWVVGVVLTGHLDNGTAGLAAIKDQGGITVIQDPAEAQAPSMPLSAAAQVPIDYCRCLADIGPLLADLAKDPPPDVPAPRPKPWRGEASSNRRPRWRRPDYNHPWRLPARSAALRCRRFGKDGTAGSAVYSGIRIRPRRCIPNCPWPARTPCGRRSARSGRRLLWHSTLRHPAAAQALGRTSCGTSRIGCGARSSG